MSGSWNTKHGSRRVRRDPPTLAEAIAAAQGLSDDREQQAEIAASLMGVSLTEARAEMRKLGTDRAAQTATVVPSHDKGGARTVVVERRASRRFVAAPGRPALARPAMRAQQGR